MHAQNLFLLASPNGSFREVLACPAANFSCAAQNFVSRFSNGEAVFSRQHIQAQRQLIRRAATAGLLLGGFMSLSNLSVSLKTDGSMGTLAMEGSLLIGAGLALWS